MGSATDCGHPEFGQSVISGFSNGYHQMTNSNISFVNSIWNPAIRSNSDPILKINFSSFWENKACNQGSNMFVDGKDFELSFCNIVENSILDGYPLIFYSNTNCFIENCIFARNTNAPLMSQPQTNFVGVIARCNIDNMNIPNNINTSFIETEKFENRLFLLNVEYCHDIHNAYFVFRKEFDITCKDVYLQ